MHVDAIRIAYRKPDLASARREFHVEHGRSWLELMHHTPLLDVDNLNGIVVRRRKVDPYFPAIGPSDAKDRLAVNGNTTGFLETLVIDDQNLMVSDGGKEK